MYIFLFELRIIVNQTHWFFLAIILFQFKNS
jgi:hypothetical protein